jgi:regulator of replication initiation timing
MPLSISKLEKLLNSYGFIVRSIFSIHKEVTYVELFDVSHSENFFLYVPSKYKIPVNGDSYELSNVSSNGEEEVIPDDDIEDENDDDALRSYGGNIQLVSDNKTIKTTLLEGYDYSINLKSGQNLQVKELYSQLNRYSMPVQNLKYKFLIISDTYLGVIKRDNSISVFFIKEYTPYQYNRIYVIIDLDTLFLNPSLIPKNVSIIRKSFFQIISTNHQKHSSMIQELYTKQDTFMEMIAKLVTERNRLDLAVQKLEELLTKLINSENDKFNELQNFITTNGQGDSDITGIYNDMKISHQRNKIQKEMDKILSVKQTMIKEIMLFKAQQENLALIMDNVFFHNTIEMYRINSNLTQLQKL